MDEETRLDRIEEKLNELERRFSVFLKGGAVVCDNDLWSVPGDLDCPGKEEQ